MEQLIKQTKNGPELNGYEKTAILLGELDSQAATLVLQKLELTPEQSRKLRKTMKKLGKYDPNNLIQVSRELSVLNQAVSFLQRKMDYSFEKTKQNLQLNLKNQQMNLNLDRVKAETEDEVAKVTSKKPEDVAKILKTWLGE